MTHWPTALKGVGDEVREGFREGFPRGLRRLGRVGSVVLEEGVLGTLRLAPYGARAWLAHRYTPEVVRDPESGAVRRPGPASSSDTGHFCAAIEHAVPYRVDPRSSHARHVVDVYVPTVKATGAVATRSPVALFVHGGVWSAGDRWHYAPMGRRLAEEGVVTMVASYPLYPEVQVEAQIEAVDAALTFAMDAAEGYGGDKDAVYAVGHSSGAHVLSNVLWRRAQSKGGGDARDTRMPKMFVGMAGVYDVATHLEYEKGRGVASMSALTPVMNGACPVVFKDTSPAVQAQALVRDRDARGVSRPAARTLAFLAGTRITAAAASPSSRGGIPDEISDPFMDSDLPDLGSAGAADMVEPVLLPRGYKPPPNGQKTFQRCDGPDWTEHWADLGDEGRSTKDRVIPSPPPPRDWDAPPAPEPRGLRPASASASEDSGVVALDATSTSSSAVPLPPVLLMASPHDVTVPPTQSGAFVDALQSLGVPAGLLTYQGLGHADFVTAFGPRAPAPAHAAAELRANDASLRGPTGPFTQEHVLPWQSGLAPHAADLLTVLTQRVPLGTLPVLHSP